MARKLKVYGWCGYRIECKLAPNGSRQTREICAAHSIAEIKRIYGVNPWNICETGNEKEISIAMSSPGTIFWIPLDESYRSDSTAWIEVEKG